MKIVKPLLAVAAGLAISATAHAQLFVTVGAGYGMGANKQLMFIESTSNPSSSTDKVVFASFGGGIAPALGIGYMVNDNFGIEGNFSYLLGSKIGATSDENPTSGWTINTVEEAYARSIRIGIGTRIGFGEDAIRPYMRGGLMLGVGNKFTYTFEETETMSSVTTETKYTEEYDGGTAIGYYGGIGMTYNMSDMMGIFFELTYVGQSWAPMHSAYTEYTVDGADVLGNMTTDQKETNYVEEITYDSNPPSTSDPSESYKWSYPMSSFGLNVGIKITLGQ